MNNSQTNVNGFWKFIVYLLVGWGVWMLIVSSSANKVKDVVRDYEQSYNEMVEARKSSLELVGNVSVTSEGGYGYYTHHFEGILKNVSGRKIDYAQVSFVVYDKAGNNIGSAFDNVNYIDANGTWKFSAMYFGKESKIKYNPVPEITVW